MVARAIVGSGLHPAFGLHHHNQYNGLCLADDLMEPFRPWVDLLVYQIIQEYKTTSINIETKTILIGLLNEKVKFEKKDMPLMISCHHLMANMKRCYNGIDSKVIYPELSIII